jgi:transposase-like protein
MPEAGPTRHASGMMDGTIALAKMTDAQFPKWLPAPVRLYLDHTEDGLSIRELARREGRHASTIMRQVRRYENRRDDPLMDEALSAFSRIFRSTPTDITRKDTPMISAQARPRHADVDETALLLEGRRILRRLAEPGAVMAIAPEMEKAVVMREYPDGRSMRTGVLDRTVAQAFTLKDWIACKKAGRVSTYEITAAGRAALKRMIDDEDRRRQGLQEGATPFGDQHRVWGEKSIHDDDGRESEGPRRVRYNLAESPIGVLGRRRD